MIGRRRTRTRRRRRREMKAMLGRRLVSMCWIGADEDSSHVRSHFHSAYPHDFHFDSDSSMTMSSVSSLQSCHQHHTHPSQIRPKSTTTILLSLLLLLLLLLFLLLRFHLLRMRRQKTSLGMIESYILIFDTTQIGRGIDDNNEVGRMEKPLPLTFPSYSSLSILLPLPSTE